MGKFNPDYSHRTDYTTEYPFDSVIFPTDAPLLAQDLNEMQDIQNNKLNSLNYALYTDGYIHTGEEPLLSPNSDSSNDNFHINVNGYVLISGKLYSICHNVTISKRESGSHVYIVINHSEFTADSAIPSHGLLPQSSQQIYPSMNNYLNQNSFEEAVSKRDGYTISFIVTNNKAMTFSSPYLHLIGFEGSNDNQDVAYMAPAPAPKKMSEKSALLDMRVGKTFRCYDTGVKSFEYHFEDNGTFYYVIDNGASTNNVELYRSNDLVNWEKCSLHLIMEIKHCEVSFTDVVNGHIFLFTTDGNMCVSTDKGDNWSATRIENGDSVVGIGLFQCKVVPVGNTDANVLCVTPDHIDSIVQYQIKHVYRGSNKQWTSEKLPYDAIPYGTRYELPKIGNYVVTPANDVCIPISGLRFQGCIDYCYSFILAFTCESGKLVYNDMIVASISNTDDGLYINRPGECPELIINVAGDYAGCPNPDRCISYIANYPVYSEHRGLKIWCLENAGSVINLDEDGSPNDYRLDLYSSAYTVRSGDYSSYSLILANDFYFMLNHSNYSVDVWNTENCDFKHESCLRDFVVNASLETSKYGLLPIYSDFYNGALWLWKSGGGNVFDKDTRFYSSIRQLPGANAANNILPGKDISFLTDKNGKVYAVWRNDDLALPKYYISSLSRDLVWSEPKEITVDKCEELKPFYADHAIYFENNSSIYISGEIK